MSEAVIVSDNMRNLSTTSVPYQGLFEREYQQEIQMLGSVLGFALLILIMAFITCILQRKSYQVVMGNFKKSIKSISITGLLCRKCENPQSVLPAL